MTFTVFQLPSCLTMYMCAAVILWDSNSSLVGNTWHVLEKYLY